MCHYKTNGQDVKSVENYREEQLYARISSTKDARELCRLLSNIHVPSLLARCARRVKSRYIREACIVRIDDLAILRQLQAIAAR